MKITSATTSAADIVGKQQDKKLKQSCEDFESIFLNMMLKSMRKTVQKSNIFGESSGEDMFREMLDSEVAKSSAKSHTSGIADILYRQLSKTLETQNTQQQDAARSEKS